MARVVKIARYEADGAQVTREFSKMGEAGEKMGERVKKGAGAMSSSLRAIDATAGVARDKVEGFASQAGSAGTVLRSLGPAGLAAAAGIGVITAGFVALQNATRDAVRELGAIPAAAARVGVSTDTLQEMRFAVLGIGGAAEQADQALTQFAEKIGEATLMRSGGGFNALQAIGFSTEDIANMRSVEDALPRIADRIAGMADATEQMRIAKELGLDPLLPLLQQGAGAFDRAAQAAHDMGYVLDRDLLSRAAEFNGQWEQAARVLDVQMKSALVDLAPIFIDLARVIADTTRGLMDFLDQFDRVENRSTRNLVQQQASLSAERFELLSRFGDGITSGGNAMFALDPNLVVTEGLARDRYAFIVQEQSRVIAELRQRAAAPSVELPTASTRTGMPSSTVDAELARHQQFIDQMREELSARDALAAVQAQFPKASLEEAEARLALSEQLDAINAARAAGVEAAEAELTRMRDLAVANYEQAEATRANAEAQARFAQQAAEHDRLLQSLETPQERIGREISLLQKNTNLSPDEIARGVARLRDEYRELAAAQFEASLAGQALAGVMAGHIRDFGDLGLLLKDLVADAAIREMLAGGVLGEGGVGGYFSRVGDRIAGGLTGDDSASMDSLFGNLRDMFSPLEDAAKRAGGVLADELAGGALEAASKTALGTVETLRETGAKSVSATTLGVLSKSAQMAAQALAAVAAANKADGIAGLFSSILGGGNPTAVLGPSFGPKGGGRAGGGPLIPGYAHAFAETRPELSIVGGWGQVAPPAAVEGLAVLAQLSRAMQAPAPASAAARGERWKVNVINQYGADLNVETREGVSADGEQMLDVVLTRKMGAKIANGGIDAEMGARFGASRRRIPR